MSDLQRTYAWHKSRLGKVTASRVFDVCKKLKKGGYSAERNKYMLELMAEKLTGNPTDFYISPSMQWGIDTEQRAKEAYFLETMRAIEEVGFIDHPSIENSGSSPDGLIDIDGHIEVKCPESHNHLATYIEGVVNPEYIYQMMLQMMCTGRKWCDFVSFDDRLQPSIQLKIIRVDFNQAIADEIEFEVVKFNVELSEKLEQLRAA